MQQRDEGGSWTGSEDRDHTIPVKSTNPLDHAADNRNCSDFYRPNLLAENRQNLELKSKLYQPCTQSMIGVDAGTLCYEKKSSALGRFSFQCSIDQISNHTTVVQYVCVSCNNMCMEYKAFLLFFQIKCFTPTLTTVFKK